VQNSVPDAVSLQKKNQRQNVVQNATAKMLPSPCIVTSVESSYNLSGSRFIPGEMGIALHCREFHFAGKVQGLKYRDGR